MFTIQMSVVVAEFVRICLGLSTRSPEIVNGEEIIPFIIGTSLMGFVIIILLAVLLVCFCIKQHEKKQNKVVDVEEIPEEVKLVKFKERKSSAMKSNKVAPLLVVEKVQVHKSEVREVGKLSMQLPKPKQYRRASVPAVLSALPEASPSLEASRKMSLSYNCVLEPIHNSNKVTKTEADQTLPESGPSTDIFSLKLSEDQASDVVPRRYSVYDDESLSSEELNSKYGKIIFSLQYNFDAKTLEVTLIRAQYLTGQRIKGKNHFYVKLKLTKPVLTQYGSTTSLSGVPYKGVMKPIQSTKGTFRTSIQADFCNPNFEETFKFTNVTSDILDECVLQFIIKEEKAKFLEKNRVIGQVNFQLSDAQLIDKHELITEIVRYIMPMKHTESKGHAMISLYYNRPLGVLSVSVMEIIPGVEPLIDVSIEICLRSIDNVIISKRIQLPEDLKSNRTLELSVDNCLMNSFCLVILVFSRVRNCPKTSHGRVVIGPIRFSDGPGLLHWAEMSMGDRVVVKTHEIV